MLAVDSRVPRGKRLLTSRTACLQYRYIAHCLIVNIMKNAKRLQAKTNFVRVAEYHIHFEFLVSEARRNRVNSIANPDSIQVPKMQDVKRERQLKLSDEMTNGIARLMTIESIMSEASRRNNRHALVVTQLRFRTSTPHSCSS
jgi:hypothetical protein